MFVTTATSRASFRNERSDSSASSTTQSPVPQPAFVPAERSSPPIRKPGSRPHSSSTWAAIDAVVVLPWVPEIAIARLSRETSPRRSPRWRSRPAALSSGLSSGIAVETTTSAPSGTFAASWPITGSMPAWRRRSQ